MPRKTRRTKRVRRSSRKTRHGCRQTCELQHTSKYPVRFSERDTMIVKQSQGWLKDQTLRGGNYVATRKSDRRGQKGMTLFDLRTRAKKQRGGLGRIPSTAIVDIQADPYSARTLVDAETAENIFSARE